MSLDDFYLAGRTMNLHVAGELKDAEASRLASVAMAGRAPRRRFCRGVLAWLGYRLIAWGQGLEDHYSNVPSTPVSHSANHLST